MGYLRDAVHNFFAYAREFGFRGAVQIFANNRAKAILCKINVRNYTCPFYYRKNTTDLPILRFIIGQELIFKDIDQPRLIIDAGANVGYVGIYYANRFPNCRITAIEMESSNFQVLEKNTSGYHNIKGIKAALWYHHNGVQFGESKAKDSFNLFSQSRSMQPIPSITLPEVIGHSRKVDLIKLDIEGAEIEVLNNMKENNIQPSVLVVELHDRFRNGCSQALNDYLAGRTYRREKIYEYEVIRFGL
jgi:FkbM family methyltransferase